MHWVLRYGLVALCLVTSVKAGIEMQIPLPPGVKTMLEVLHKSAADIVKTCHQNHVFVPSEPPPNFLNLQISPLSLTMQELNQRYPAFRAALKQHTEKTKPINISNALLALYTIEHESKLLDYGIRWHQSMLELRVAVHYPPELADLLKRIKETCVAHQFYPTEGTAITLPSEDAVAAYSVTAGWFFRKDKDMVSTAVRNEVSIKLFQALVMCTSNKELRPLFDVHIICSCWL